MANHLPSRLAPGSPMTSGSYFWTYMQLADQWRGCDWPTQFGQADLNLSGLRAAQAILLAEATSGSEAADWLAAAEWLSQVERDAQRATARAAKAAELAEAGKLPEALRRIEEACAIESQYHANLVWRPLREAIAAALAKQRETSAPSPTLDTIHPRNE